MNIKKRFKKSKKYYLKHINSEIYKQEKISYDASRKQDHEEFLQFPHFVKMNLKSMP